MTQLTCIVCPRGCHLEVDEENGYTVTGAGCPRGEAYGKKELTAPTRTVTSTVSIHGALHHRLPVRSNTDVPKALLRDVVSALHEVKVEAPVHVGDVIVKNILDSGADIVAAKTMNKE